MIRRNRDRRKKDLELAVFLGFAEFAALKGLHVRPDSAESRDPPEPDILCEVEGEGPVAFELVNTVDPDLAEDISISAHKGTSPRGACTADQTMDRIRGKLAKTYETPHPMELVVWANPSITPPSIWLPSYESHLKALRGTSRFRRVWFVNLGGPDDERGVWFVDPPVG